MCKLIDRITNMDIYPEDHAFQITNQDLITAIAEHVDMETVTDHELREIFFIVKRSLTWINWQSTVEDAINHLPFGLNQTSLAWNGINPCPDCPDGMIEGDHCYHKHICKAWEIYETTL
jgi:hypothetical protein